MSASTVAGGARLKKPSWKDPKLLVGILLVLASVAGVISLVGAADQTAEAYTAREAIAVGEKLTVDKLNRVRVRLGDLEQHYLTPATGVAEDSWPPRESARTSWCRARASGSRTGWTGSRSR